MKKILSYLVKSIVKWGASGTVVFITKEARECGMKIGSPVVISVEEDKSGKHITVRKLPVKLKKK